MSTWSFQYRCQDNIVGIVFNLIFGCMMIEEYINIVFDCSLQIISKKLICFCIKGCQNMIYIVLSTSDVNPIMWTHFSHRKTDVLWIFKFVDACYIHVWSKHTEKTLHIPGLLYNDLSDQEIHDYSRLVWCWTAYKAYVMNFKMHRQAWHGYVCSI